MQNEQQEKPVIQKRMEKESAIKILNEIRNSIGCTDLSNICGDELEINPEDTITQRLIQAIQCGLVFWDEQANCLTQKLIRPLKCGELTAIEFQYKNRLNIQQLKGVKAISELDFLEKVLSQITGRPTHLIGQLSGQDVEVATGCVGFFDK